MRANLPEQLLETSQEVLRDCALPNGAIVAANSTRPDYPPTAENYHYNWGRDTAYQLVAAHAIGMPDAPDIRRRYLQWLQEQNEAFASGGSEAVLVKRYYPNGPADWRYGTEYQPDQAGALLWALHETTEDPDSQTDDVMRSLANGLASTWNGTGFNRTTQDLWENYEIEARPIHGDYFPYTLAACVQGLSAAIERLDHSALSMQREEWSRTRNDMRLVLASGEGYGLYTRKMTSEGPTKDGVDASLSALVWPYHNSPLWLEGKPRIDQTRVGTVQAIGEKLLHLPEGVYRYEGDTYDGIVRPGGGETAAGTWPLLAFWHAIAMNRLGKAEHAQNVYDQTLERLNDLYSKGRVVEGHIPEQFFPDDERQGQGITPLGWSHAKYILAALKLRP